VVTLKELNPHNFPVTKEQETNSLILLMKINKIRTAWGKPMTVTSGFRSKADHLRIYKEMGITDQNLIPMNSKHLSFEAVDISDPDGKLMEWCKANEHILEDAGLWCEEKDDKKRVHFQIVPPRSGKRFFKP
jgi:uncharacterized protein YcbK (DUF882 family)